MAYRSLRLLQFSLAQLDDGTEGQAVSRLRELERRNRFTIQLLGDRNSLECSVRSLCPCYGVRTTRCLLLP
jgi:hypothetical protein